MKRSKWFSGFLLAEENVAEAGLVVAKRFFNEQFWEADKDGFDEGYLDYLDNYYQRKIGVSTYEYRLSDASEQCKQPSPTRSEEVPLYR